MKSVRRRERVERLEAKKKHLTKITNYEGGRNDRGGDGGREGKL